MPRRFAKVSSAALVPDRGRKPSDVRTNAKLTSPVSVPRVNAPAGGGSGLSPVVLRFALQAGARELLRGVQLKGEFRWSKEVKPADLKTHRVCHCLRRVQNASKGVDLIHHAGTKSGSFGNLQTCASVHACPVCSAKITERRRVEVRSAVDQARAQGLKIVLITRTVSHYASETSVEVLALIKRAAKYLANGERAQKRRDRWGVVGFIRSLEVTHGANGWHFHYHELLFLRPGYDLDALRAFYSQEWAAAVVVAGGRALSERHGLDAVDCDARIADYVAKWGKEPLWQEDRELTKSPSKLGKHGGRSPLQLLHDYVFARDVQAGWIWKEYALAMHGSHQLQWSRGLKAMFGIVAKKDAEIEQEQTEGGASLATVPLEGWRLLCQRELRGQVLELVAAGDVVALNEWLNFNASGEWGESGEELRRAEAREHGWRVTPRNVRERTDAGICWQVEQVVQAAELFGWVAGGDAANNAAAMEQGRAALLTAQTVRKEAGGPVACAFTAGVLSSQRVAKRSSQQD